MNRWKKISAHFQSKFGKHYQVPVLQMRLKRIREGICVWTENDVHTLKTAYKPFRLVVLREKKAAAGSTASASFNSLFLHNYSLRVCQNRTAFSGNLTSLTGRQAALDCCNSSPFRRSSCTVGIERIDCHLTPTPSFLFLLPTPPPTKKTRPKKNV